MVKGTHREADSSAGDAEGVSMCDARSESAGDVGLASAGAVRTSALKTK